MDTFRLRIVTPDKDYMNDNVQGVTLSTSNGGKMTIYAHHADLIANIDISPLEITNNGHRTYYAVGGGALHIRNRENLVTLIVNSIESIDEIDLARAKESKVRAEKIIGEAKTPREALELERQIKRAINRIKVKTDFRNV